MHRQLSRRERKKLETRQRLMEAALRLFGEHGFEATTIEDITSVADVAKGTFFNYFQTKEAIIPAIAARRLEQLDATLAPEQGAPDSAVARIKLALRLVAESPLCQERLAEQVFKAMMHRHEISPPHALRDLLARQVDQAQAAGEIRRSLDPMYLAGAIRALFFERLVMWHQGYRPASLRELIDGSVDLLMEGAAGPNWKRTS